MIIKSINFLLCTKQKTQIRIFDFVRVRYIRADKKFVRSKVMNEIGFLEDVSKSSIYVDFGETHEVDKAIK